MSEVITVGTGSETIHGSQAAAIAYVAIMFGDTYTTWAALTSDNQKKTLAAAVRYLNQQVWTEDADTFAEREALLVNSVAVFHHAQYELAVMINADPTLTGLADQGSNIKAVGAGSASVEFFNPTTKGAALLPPVLMRLVGGYLAISSTSGPDGGAGCPGSSSNPFSDCNDFDRNEPY